MKPPPDARQLSWLASPPPPPAFGGATYDPALDAERLFQQLARVRAVMLDGAWRTLAALSAAVGAPEASVSARLRDLRKPRFGGWHIERRRVPEGHGLHEYRLRDAD